MEIFNEGTRQDEIGIAAVELFHKKGYHATGMRELSAMLGMTVANLYNFFPSKEDLLFYVLERGMKTLIQNLKKLIDSNDDPAVQLIAAIHYHVRFHGENQKVGLVSDSELRGLQGKALERIIEYRDRYEDIFREILAKGVQSGSFTPVDPKLTTLAILTMCSQVAYWYRPQGKWSIEDIAQNYSRFALDGLRPR